MYTEVWAFDLPNLQGNISLASASAIHQNLQGKSVPAHPHPAHGRLAWGVHIICRHIMGILIPPSVHTIMMHRQLAVTACLRCLPCGLHLPVCQPPVAHATGIKVDVDYLVYLDPDSCHTPLR